MLVADPAKLGRDPLERVFPRRLDELAVVANQRTGETVRRADEAVREATLDAGVAAVDRRVAVRLDEGDLVVAGVDVERAADSAIAAGRRGDTLDRLGSRSPGSLRAPLGQLSTQAPHDTQSDSAQLPPDPGATTVSKPRPTIARAKVPWTSSQIRTQRAQAMQSSGSSVT